MSEPVVRVAPSDEHELVARFYRREEGRSRSIDPTDTIVIAECDGHILGVARLCREHGCLVLRGMRVREDQRHRGIGSRLLEAVVKLLGELPCYCLPFAHLVGFYARAGFSLLPDDRAPPFLRERANRYREKGEAIAPMLRRAT